MKKNIKTRPAFFALPRWCGSVTFFSFFHSPSSSSELFGLELFREEKRGHTGRVWRFFVEGDILYIYIFIFF